jgi:hypothetical protein
VNNQVNPRVDQVKQVTVLDLNPGKGVALCRDSEGQFVEVQLAVHRTGMRPQLNQLWLVDRAVGAWSLRALLLPEPMAPPSLVFTDAAERDLWLPEPVHGLLVWLEDSHRFWQYAAAGWVPLVQDPLLDSPWQPLTGSTLVNPGHGKTAAYRVTGGRVVLRGRLALSGGGSIADLTLLGVVPSALAPVGVVAGGNGQCQDSTGRPSVVRIEITNTTGEVTLLDNHTTRPTWIGLDGVSWWLD